MRSAVLFDLDGTLLDSASDIARALSSLRCARGGSAISAAEVRPLVSLGANILLERVLGPFATEPSNDLVEFRAILGALSADPTTVYRGAAEALETLVADGHVLAIVTNKPEALSRSLLTQLGLADRFATIVGGDTAGRAKPDPEPLLKALELIGMPASHAVFVGDSPVDAQAAQACAMPFVLYEGGYGAHDCITETVHARFGDFGILPMIITDLVSQPNFVVAGVKLTG